MMDEQRLGRALRQGPPFATQYIERPLTLDDEAVARRTAGAGRLVLLVAVTALLLTGVVASLAAVGGLRDDEPPDGPVPLIIEGLEAQGLIDAWIASSSRAVCNGPTVIAPTLSQWTCGMRGDDALHDYEIIIVGESLSAIHSIEAWIARDDGASVDPVQASGLFALVIESADYVGSDTAAAAAWIEGWPGDQEPRAFNVSGVTYTLSGPAERRVLNIAPSQPSPFPTLDPSPSCLMARSDTDLNETPRGPLEPGTYSYCGVGTGNSNARFLVPAGWEWHGSYLSKGSASEEARIDFFDGFVQVYTDPCHWSAAEADPRTGLAVVDLMEALAAQPMRSATVPAPRNAGALDGPAGWWNGMAIELTVPDDVRFDECDEGEFRSWEADSGSRSHQAPGQRDLVWAVNLEGGGPVTVGGERLIFDASWLPGTPSDVLSELDAILDSIVVGHWG